MYLDPLHEYVPRSKVKTDIDVVNRIIFYRVLGNSIESPTPSNIPGYEVVTSTSFGNSNSQQLPKQRGGHDCGVISVLYFMYIVGDKTFDFAHGDMLHIRRWFYAILTSSHKEFTEYIAWFTELMGHNRFGGLKLKNTTKQAEVLNG